LVLASALTQHIPGASCIIATGSPCATHFALPERVGIVKLPSITKNTGGAYVPREIGGEVEFALRIRRRLLMELYRSFAPQLLVVDHQVLGLGGELLPLLEQARRRGTRTILGVRDIIDTPEVVAREWGEPNVRWALGHAYDRVCVYGDPAVFDTRLEYPIPPELSKRLEFCGYVVRPARPRSPRALPPIRPHVLVTMGGGEDGGERVNSYLDALELAPVRFTSTVVTGPLLDAERVRALRRRARMLPGVHLQQFHADMPALYAEANAVVAMSGYNTSAELLQAGLPTVFLPRTFPRREQALRAERLAQLGLAQCLVQPRPERLREAVEAAVESPRRRSTPIPLNGAERLAHVASELLGMPARASHAELAHEARR
jgi:predicted glycosyltransferase